LRITTAGAVAAGLTARRHPGGLALHRLRRGPDWPVLTRTQRPGEAPSIGFYRPTHLIPTTFRHQTTVGSDRMGCRSLRGFCAMHKIYAAIASSDYQLIIPWHEPQSRIILYEIDSTKKY
jgi:hypothetical protein